MHDAPPAPARDSAAIMQYGSWDVGEQAVAISPSTGLRNPPTRRDRRTGGKVEPGRFPRRHRHRDAAGQGERWRPGQLVNIVYNNRYPSLRVAGYGSHIPIATCGAAVVGAALAMLGYSYADAIDIPSPPHWDRSARWGPRSAGTLRD